MRLTTVYGMCLLFHPTHCLSHMYLPELIFDLVTICGEGDESLETHHVFPLDPRALTIISLNSLDALDHNNCSSPSESVLLMNMHGIDKFLPDSLTFCDSLTRIWKSSKHCWIAMPN